MPVDGGQFLAHAATVSVSQARDAELGAGALVGAYTIEAICSKGGFGTVYRARNTSSGEPAALKVLHELLVSSKTILQRFEQEAAMMRRIEHPSIVRIHDVGYLADGRPFLA